MNMKMKTLSPGGMSAKDLFVIVLSFVMSLAIIFLTAVVVSNMTLFNDRGLYSKVAKTTYFSELNNEIVTRCKTIAAQSGIDYEAVEPVLSSNRVSSDFSVYFNAMNGKNPHAGQNVINTDKLADELYNSIVKYDPDITKNQKENAQRIAVAMANEYQKIFVLESFEKFIGFSETFKTYSNYVFCILLAVVIYLGLVIFSMNGRRQKHRLLRRFSVTSGSAGLTVLCLSLIMKFTGVFGQITFVSSQREYNLFMSFFDDFVNVLVISGAAWLVACIGLMLIWYLSVTGRIRK